MPLGYPLFPRVKGNTSEFQVVSFTFAAREAVWQLPITLLKRGEGTSKGKMTFTSKALTFETDEGFDYTLDGELFETKDKKFPVTMGPEIEFLRI